MREFRSDCTWGDPDRIGIEFSPLDDAYDWGREWAHRLTLRMYDYEPSGLAYLAAALRQRTWNPR